jgi:hypothetical protein
VERGHRAIGRHFFAVAQTFIAYDLTDYADISFIFFWMAGRRRGNASCTCGLSPPARNQMADRRTAERLIVPPESLQRISMRDTPDPVDEPPEEQTQPMRLSFLALLAERDPAVQARLNLRRKLALECELPEEDDRPTDPMLELDEPA